MPCSSVGNSKKRKGKGNFQYRTSNTECPSKKGKEQEKIQYPISKKMSNNEVEKYLEIGNSVFIGWKFKKKEGKKEYPI